MNDQRTRCMAFLYNWITKGHASNMRRGMVEELQAFVNNEIALEQAQQTAARVQAAQDAEAQADIDAVGDASIVASVSKEFDKDSQ